MGFNPFEAIAKHWKTIATIAASTLVFVAVTAATGGLGAPLLLALAAGGLASGAFGYALGQWLAGQPITAKGLITSALVSGAISVATLGLGRAIAPLLPASTGAATGVAATVRTVAADAVAGGAIGGGITVATNAATGRPLGENVGTGVLTGAATGVVARPLANAISAPIANAAAKLRAGPTPATKGVAPALEELSGGKPTRGSVGYASVHEAPPRWLSTRFGKAVADVEAGRGIPGSDPKTTKAFLHETYEHVNEVNELSVAMGGRARPVPNELAPNAPIRGVHDFGERVSLAKFEEFVAKAHETPITDRQGNKVPVPEWLDRFVAEARASGDSTVDVGKLNPYVASGLGRDGPPDAYALAIHNLSPHHTASAMRGNVLIESIADRINAMRQIRVYRPKPMPFDKIESILMDEVSKGSLPPESADLIRKGIEAQKLLERAGRVNPYHLAE